MHTLIRLALVFVLAGPLSAAAQDLEIPRSVTGIYVFLQKPGEPTRGSSEAVADSEDPKTFASNLSRYIALAKRKQMRLIVTAEAPNGWVQNAIRYKNKQLATAKYWHPDPKIDRPVGGAEIPLD